MEILAPAGSKEALIAAVRSGADAVYLGGKAFNARRNADNFDDAALAEAAEYCHARNVKLYLTLNTLISDDEIETAMNTVENACAVGVDALIVQDLAFAELVKKSAPNMPLHASTQMSVQTVEGLKLLENLGFTRAVLPRELSKEEISNITANSPIESEVFVHGALCMSVSGQCYMSAVLGSRSGNRGLCAQPCRLKFSCGGDGNFLSLKDLSLIKNLPELEKIGVVSAKIEGRMKRPEYVAAAVTACRYALEGKSDEKLYFDLKSVFSRSGFTDGYYKNKLGKDMFGIRTKEDVTAASKVLSELKELYRKERQTIPVKFVFTALDNEAVTLSASAMGKNAFVKSDFIPQPAINKPLDYELIEKQLGKTGGTQFYTEDIEAEFDEGINVPPSVINNLRRDVLASLESKFSKKKIDYTPLSVDIEKHKPLHKKIYARFADIKNIPENFKADLVIVPLFTPENELEVLSKKYDLAVEIPRGIFSTDKIIEEKLKFCKIKKAFAGTLDGISLAKKYGFYIIGGYGTNIYNSVAVNKLENMGVSETLLSAELLLQKSNNMGGDIPRGIIAYGRLPLMLTRNCPIRNKYNCSECGSTKSLIDRKGIEFPVRCNNKCSEILNSRPIVLSDRLSEMRGLDFILMYFTIENKQETVEVIKNYRNRSEPNGEYTRGLYYRGVI